MKLTGVLPILLYSAILFSCRETEKKAPSDKLLLLPPVLEYNAPVDSMLTIETRALWLNLMAIRGKGIMFGQQDANLIGVDWQYDDNRSDIGDLTGTHPALYGYELSGAGNESNSDSIPFDLIRIRMTEAFVRGGVNTVTWHLNNPVTGGTAWDVTNAVKMLLPDSVLHENYKSELIKIGNYFKSLKTVEGGLVPVIFRPFHETNGNWFWWGKGRCTAAEYIALWQFTVTYLRDSLHVHNLLYAYSVDMFDSEAEYLERYPGDNWVDILGAENYWDFQSGSSISNGISQLRLLIKMANERNKLAALTECGFNGIPVRNWWTQFLLKSVKDDSLARNISYLMVWRNANMKQYYTPFTGQKSAPDFIAFEKDSFTLFENDLPDMYLINSH